MVDHTELIAERPTRKAPWTWACWAMLPLIPGSLCFSGPPGRPVSRAAQVQPQYAPQMPVARMPVPMMQDYSLIHIEAPEPPQIKVHDIITVIVDEKAEVTGQSRYNRQKTGALKAELKEFIRFDDDMNLASAATNAPTVDSTLQSNLQNRGQLETREGMKYRIAATVVDVLPNGTIVLEARKSIRNNWDVWEYSLTGRVRVQDILANNTVLSENIAEMDVVKRERGRLRDTTRRGWFLTTFDFLSPI